MTGWQWETHRTEQAVENVDFLLDSGESLGRALRRAGISEDAYEQRQRRRGWVRDDGGRWIRPQR